MKGVCYFSQVMQVKLLKKANKKYASIERYVKEVSGKIFEKGKRIKYRGAAVNIFKNNAEAVVFIGIIFNGCIFFIH